MTFEKIRVGARMKLVGRVKTGNILVAFSVCLRVAVYCLAVLAVIHFKYFYSSVGGRVLILMSFTAVLLGVLLLQCTRTVKDRWFSALNSSKPVCVSDIVAVFSLRDIVRSVKCGILSFAYSLLRFVLFAAFPSLLSFLLWVAVRDGISRTVFFIFVSGFAVITVCSVLFLSVSLRSVSLARSLCRGSAGEFMRALRILENNSFLLFKFSLFLSIFNRCTRRFSEIVFAGMLLESDYTFL